MNLYFNNNYGISGNTLLRRGYKRKKEKERQIESYINRYLDNLLAKIARSLFCYNIKLNIMFNIFTLYFCNNNKY
jgi:hypothetical protein